MKKLAHLGALLGIVTLVILLAVGVVAAGSLSQEPEPEVEVEPEPGLPNEPVPEPAPGEAGQGDSSGTAARINFEFSNHSARAGTYIVQESGGRIVARWYAQDGWRDSGWINNLNISHEAVHVRVLYYASAEATPIVMRILNPAAGTSYGWLARGQAHALEVAFPDTAVVVSGTTVYPATGGVVTAVPVTVAPAQAGEQIYVVQLGDNLFRIGLQFGCSYVELAAFNGIANPDLIFAGQQIRIPTNCVG